MLDNEILKKLFYYCLKRTGNREDAEDLSGDISLEVLTMLNRGYKPENFYAWLWTVARAKYANWVKKKMISSQVVTSVDIFDNSYISSYEDVEEHIVRKEEISLLRRELSIMSREYREITVAYYIDNQKISDISRAVNLPEGTIKRKLFESRKYLKEGINMTRTYGKRSYSPDNIDFRIDTRNAKDRVPYSLIDTKLAKNILLEAYINPCSTEELSISLGVASPYLEEVLDKLVEGLLIAKTKDNKYETDFIILDMETQKKIFDKTLETADKICDKIMFCAGCNSNLAVAIEKMDVLYIKENQSMLAKKYIDKFVDENVEQKLNDEQKVVVQEQYSKIIEKWKNNFGNYSTGGAISADLSMWFYLFKTLRDMVVTTEAAKEIFFVYPKQYKGEWSIVGFEDYTSHEILKYSVGQDWDFGNEVHSFKYEFKTLGLSQVKSSKDDIRFFADILKNNKKFSDLSETEKNIANELVKKDLAVVEEDNVKPTFPILYVAGLDKLNDYFLESDFPDELKAIIKAGISGSEEIAKICHEEILNLFEYNLEQIKIGLPSRFDEQAKFCARDMLHYLHNAVLKYTIEREYLPMTDKPVGIGAYVV